MVMTISANKIRHRADSPDAPVFTGSGWTTIPKWFIRNHFYALSASPFTWLPPNRTDTARVALRDLGYWNWTLSPGIALDGANNIFTKSGAAGFGGALGGLAAAGNCSVEGTMPNLTSTNTLCLQSGTGSFNFLDTTIEHALVFGQGGSGQIYELGVLKEKHSFNWSAGDKGLVELHGNLVRYYKISAAGEMVLLRSTRSKLSAPVAPALGIYHTGGTITEVLVWFGGEAAVEIQIYGVLKDFQDWQNKAQLDSLAEKTVNKDKSEDFTYFSEQKHLQSLSLNIGWDEGEKYRAFLEFFKWHDVSREFIFVDTARNREFFARFASGFSDSPLGADTFGMAADVREMVGAPSLIRL